MQFFMSILILPLVYISTEDINRAKFTKQTKLGWQKVPNPKINFDFKTKYFSDFSSHNSAVINFVGNDSVKH